MMSAITPMLSSSATNQPSIKPVTPTNPSSSPLGITSLPKLSATASSPATSPSKPNVSVNHSSVPLSLVHENKSNEIQIPPSAAKTPEKADKPKDLSPTKPTPNGVEEPSPKPTEEVKPSTPASQNKQNENSAEPLAPAKSESNEKPTTVAPTPAESAPAPATAPAPAPAPASATAATPAPTPEAKKEAVPEKDSDIANKSQPTQNATTLNKKNKEEEKQAAEAQPSTKRKRQKPSEPEVIEDHPKTKRIRSQVMHFQSPLPELNTIINRSLKVPKEENKSTDEKLIVFYKNEFLAVRNAEGGFYICQALQNVYRTSHRIRIKWLSKDGTGSNPDGDIYIPDFYDNTDFECILTTVALEKLVKNKYKLPKVELERTENILKRALDVEKGVEKPPEVTEEHPDGLDLSLYKDESQLQTKTKTTPKKRNKVSDDKESPKAKQLNTTSKGESKKTKKSKKKSPKKSVKSDKSAKKPVGKSEKAVSKKVEQLKGSPPNDKARVVAKVLRKTDNSTVVKETPSKKSAKHKVGKGSKSYPVKKDTKKTDKIIPVATTSKSSDRRAVIATTSRKKGGKK